MGLRVYSVKVYLNKMVITVTIGVGRALGHYHHKDGSEEVSWGKS